ncbi:hypothetical protein D3C76_966130 [compost metagenome]
MAAQRTANNQHIADIELLRAPVDVRRNGTHARSIDKQFVRRTALHHFGVASDDGNTCFPCGLRHAVDDGG